MSSLLRAPADGGGTVYGRPAHSAAASPSAAAATVFQDIETVTVGGVKVSFEAALAAVIETQKNAEAILQEARGEAARIVEEAKKRAREIRAEARARGYAEGQAQSAEDTRAAIAQGTAEAAGALREDVDAFCQAVLAEQARAWGEVEGQLRELALEIAARVVKAEITANPDVVLQITRNALRRLAGSDHARLRVNPDDVERLRARRDELMAVLEGLHAIEILEDRRIGVGGVQIETETGTVDARIDTQLAEIGQGL